MPRIMSRALGVLALAAALTPPAFAQQTTGTINGRILDDQKSAVPGATVTAKNGNTGFTRSEVSDNEGVYRLTGLPVGIYEITAQLSGFQIQTKSEVQVNVSETLTVDFDLRVASVSEEVTVRGETPLVDTTSSAVGGIVDPRRVENLPLNGRQFANLAVTVPGVGLGFHSDPTKSTQYSPQIAGGNGRNVNYQIDGGDNNDDTVGGLLQAYPLEAIQEFNFITSRYKAEYGRSNGGVMNIVTKSGTNNLQGSWFTLLRDRSMNAQTETEQLQGVDKQDYRRWQYGGSVGGPILKDRAHYFAAFERTQQDTNQAVSTSGLFPDLDGVYGTPYRETLVTGKATANVTAQQYLTVRYGRNQNSQPYAAGSQAPPDNWGTSENTFNSINVNHNWVLGGSKLNEFVFQFADFRNHISANSALPNEAFPNGVTVGQNLNTPQTTEQHKFQFRDDFSWHVSGGGGVGHDFKAGVNFINEPHLFITFNTGKGIVQYTHLTDDLGGAISAVQLNDGNSAPNIPTKQYGVYVQDDWRATDRLTLNLGLRYDIVTGIQIDQSLDPNFVAAQTAGRAGLLQGVKGWENFGKSPRDDRNNIQPRLGGVFDLRGDGRDVIRAGWGIYTDFGYTNSNVLFPAADATGSGFGPVFRAEDQNGLRNPDGTLYQVGQPLSNLDSQNQVAPGNFPLFGQFLDPRLQQPQTMQTAVGWSHQIGSTTVLSVDYVATRGKYLNQRPRVNVLNPDGTRRLGFLGLNPDSPNTRAAISDGKSEYDGLIFGIRRRLTRGIDFTGSYTLARANSTVGSAADELDANNLQDAFLLFDDPRMFGPTRRTDARHRVTASAVIELPASFRVSPIFLFRSALPVFETEGVDLNQDGQLNDIPARAFAFTDAGQPLKDIGVCKTINCGRGASFSQLNLRVSRVFHLVAGADIEAIGEIFNLFNAKNPSAFESPATVQARRLVGGVENADFIQPHAYAGDFQQPEQRVGQIGFRFTF